MRRFARNTVILLALFAIAPAAYADKYDDIEKLDPDRKIEEYQKLLAGEPKSAKILFHLGNAYHDHGSPEEAADLYRRAWQEGGEAKALLNLTFTLQELRRPDEAAAEFENGIKKLPKDPLVRAHYGDFLAAGEDVAEATRLAMEQYRIAMDIDEKCVEAHFGLGVLFARSGIYKEAIVEWERVISLDGDHHLAASARRNIERAREEVGGR